MKFSSVLAWIVLSGIVSTLALDCQKGWFGSACQYKCRCLANSCGVDGLCTNGTRCQTGWFGPACQYADLAQAETMTTRGLRPQSVVTDGRADTCLGASSREIAIRWSLPYQVTWIRVEVQDSYLLNRFSVKFRKDWNQQTPCTNMRMFKVSETSVDIACELNVTVTQVTLSWEGRAYLCSLYISGGRNVALKQNTTQSSTNLRTFKPHLSEWAVDGDTNIGSNYGNCAQTGSGDIAPKWSVLLSRNFTVNRYLLYHEFEAHYFLRRTYWFTLQGLTTDGRPVFTDRGSGATVQGVYRVTTATSNWPIGQVSIQSAGNTRRFTAAPAVLSICEVEVYGDSICDDGWYGRDCEHACNCFDETEACFVATGGCVSGCATGYMGEGCSLACPPGTFGQGCMSACSQLCLADSHNINVCDHVNGTCFLGCQIGFEGPWCNLTCAPDTYGQGCNYDCSALCSPGDSGMTSRCHHLHGVCLHGCLPGYKGIMCNEPCLPGTYGRECNVSCSEFCHGDNNNISTCDHVMGTCLLGCQTGYDGLRCVGPCPAGTYGLMCLSKCPEFCHCDDTNSPSCHHIDGSCLLGCQEGYTGQTCDTSCQPGQYGNDCVATCSELCAVDSLGTHACHHVTGMCLLGCEKGYDGAWCNKSCDNGSHGKECRSPCPQFCDVRDIDVPICHHINGTCLQGCQVGYTGPTCNKTCESGTFGQDCSFLCPQFCKVVDASESACHHVDGTCRYGCQDGFLPPRCFESCQPGMFGPYCSLHCSQFCNHGNQSCDSADGTCLHGCKSGFTGRLCNETCPPGKFGLACKFDCSHHCQEWEGSGSRCWHINGSCLFGCHEGFEGQNCTISALKLENTSISSSSSSSSSSSTDIAWVTVVVCCVAFLVAAAGVTLWRRRKQIKSHMLNIAIQVRIRKSNSMEDIVRTDVLEFGSQKISE